MIFVFGSNLKGIHGAGAALWARLHCGAVMGQGEGLQGQSYAIPTCFEPGVPLSLQEIEMHVSIFLDWARDAETALPDEHILVTRIGCGFAGYRDADIAPMFRRVPDNVWLPGAWVAHSGAHGIQCPHGSTYTLAGGWTEPESIACPRCRRICDCVPTRKGVS